jgi:hypothetical protein
MDCEGKNAYEGLSLGIWKVIWVARKAKELFWKKNYFKDCMGGIFGQKMAILGGKGHSDGL